MVDKLKSVSSHTRRLKLAGTCSSREHRPTYVAQAFQNFSFGRLGEDDYFAALQLPSKVNKSGKIIPEFLRLITKWSRFAYRALSHFNPQKLPPGYENEETT